MATIVQIILTIVSFIFTKMGDKTKLAELISKWIIQMRMKFDESAQIAKAFDSMWESAKKKKWKEQM